jgi:hypothetical protein
MHAKQWIATYADQLGIEPPSADELKAILDLDAEAAHTCERLAAPVACCLSAKAGRSLKGAICRRFQAADGTRTHDLLHGKQTHAARIGQVFPCK